MTGDDPERVDGQPLKPGDEEPPGTEQTGEALCWACQGSGRRGDAPCPTCSGTGKVNVNVGDA